MTPDDFGEEDEYTYEGRESGALEVCFCLPSLFFAVIAVSQGLVPGHNPSYEAICRECDKGN